MVRRVGFGNKEAPERRKPKPRPKRKIEKYHLEGAHEAKTEPIREPVSKQAQPQPNPSRKPLTGKRILVYLFIGMWVLPMVVGLVTMIVQKIFGGTGLSPSPIIVLVFSAFVVFKLFQLARKMMPPS